MSVIDIGSILRLHNESIVVVIGIITPSIVQLGTFYTVLEGDQVKEINKSQIKEVVNER